MMTMWAKASLTLVVPESKKRMTRRRFERLTFRRHLNWNLTRYHCAIGPVNRVIRFDKGFVTTVLFILSKSCPTTCQHGLSRMSQCTSFEINACNLFCAVQPALLSYQFQCGKQPCFNPTTPHCLAQASARTAAQQRVPMCRQSASLHISSDLAAVSVCPYRTTGRSGSFR
ncbi:uncharacterized protein M421DRAFT_215338 [Didymella exigua CBS 183.55]|uniref:Uncharacterized protein n=1 Tax=Didymella exigua CBS 183.55 TaxID=1150837 RepID=A0A6A5RH20_9PLEO|nr:uncharacterized protein M421DRAFT_215338 [Didymella exigua CBS 183.55]KAF1926384.1 hypothetical protein M421DRAFT_215338 [Didymella exigua CBS 183.55]